MEDSDQTPDIDIDIDYDIEVKKELLDEEVQHSLFMKKLFSDHEDVNPASSVFPEKTKGSLRSFRRRKELKNNGGVEELEERFDDVEEKFEDLDENEDMPFRTNESLTFQKSSFNPRRCGSRNRQSAKEEFTDLSSFNQCSTLESIEIGKPNLESGPLVAHSSRSSDGKRIYDKRFCCIYCKKLISKPSRHLETVHEDEEDVKAFFKFKRGSKERKLLIEKIRKRGEFFYTQEIISKNEGEIQPIRRPISNSKSLANEYLPCEFCLGYYFNKRLVDHQKRCHFRKDGAVIDKQEVIRKAKALRPIPDSAKDLLHTNILSRMVNDDIKRVIIGDPIVMRYGEIMCMKFINFQSAKAFIAHKLREIARVLMIARSLSSNVTDLKSCFSPGELNVVVKALKKVSKFDEKTCSFGSPEIRRKIERTFQGCCRLVKRDASINDDGDLQRKVDSFLELFMMQSKNNFVEKFISDVEERDNVIEFPAEDDDGSSTFEDAVECSNEIQNKESKVRVAVSKRSIYGKRIYDKKSFCIYCKAFVANLSKHLIAAHKNENDVKEFLKLRKGSRLRALLIGKIRKKGYFLHNQETILKKEGELLPTRRSNTETPMDDYVPCQYCLGFYSAKGLARHQKTCHFRKSDGKKSTSAVILKGQLFLAVPANVSNRLRKNLECSLSDNDPLKETILNDSVIMKFGELLYRKHINSPLKKYEVAKLRDIARYFTTLRELSPNITDFKSCFSPNSFELVVQATRLFAKYDTSTDTYESPSHCKNVGAVLEKCCRIIIRDALIDEDEQLQREAEGFLELYNTHWKEQFSKCIKKDVQTRYSPTPICDTSVIENLIQTSYSGNQEQFLKEQIKLIDESLELYSTHWENSSFAQRIPDQENSNNVVQVPTEMNDLSTFENVIQSSNVENQQNKFSGPTVVKSLNRNGKRVYDRRLCCVYCKKMVPKIAKHLEKQHKGEEDVKAFLRLEKGSKDRRILIEKLRKKGEFFHNLEAMSKTNGKVQPIKRNKAETSVSDYVPCKYCLGYYYCKGLAQHQRKCNFRNFNS